MASLFRSAKKIDILTGKLFNSVSITENGAIWAIMDQGLLMIDQKGTLMKIREGKFYNITTNSLKVFVAESISYKGYEYH